MDILLIDLSSIAHPIWHMSHAEPNPDHVSQSVCAKVHALATGRRAGVAICCDSGKSFRAEVDPTYKANRPAAEETLHHQIRLAREALKADGFPVWAAKGFEADDIIASTTAMLLEPDGENDTTVTIATADKDLLQLVGPRVTVRSIRDGAILDDAAVIEKFGVRPDQMLDYLSLVGDASDNVKGAKGIGPKRAADLLKIYDNLDDLLVAADRQDGGEGLTPAIMSSLIDFMARANTVRTLIALRTDVELPWSELFAERVPTISPMANEDQMFEEVFVSEPVERPKSTPVAPLKPALVDVPVYVPAQTPTTAIATIAPPEWERQLDPRSMAEAITLAKHMHDSRLFGAYGTPQAVLSTVLVGRELGLPAMASLRGIHIVEGRHALAAQTMVALILKSGLVEYFRPVSFSETEATYEAKRKGDGNQRIVLTHTIEMAKTAGLVKPNSGWVKNPTDMLCARASSRLARMVGPDIVGGLYTPDELKEIA
jgi:5'-3' exonuclease